MNESIELMVKKKFEKRYISIVLILASIATIYTMIFSINKAYRLLWLLPFGYFISTLFYYIVFTKANYNYGVVFIVANIIIFIRYVVTPFSIVFTSTYSGMGFGSNPSESSFSYGIILMVLELISVYLFLGFALFYYKSKQRLLSINKSNSLKILKNKVFLSLIIIIAVPFILILSPTSLMPKGLSAIGNASQGISEIPLYGVAFLIIPVVRLSFLLLGLSFIKKKYDKNNNRIYIIIAWLIVFIYLAMIISASRWAIIFSTILCILVMSELFPKTPKVFYIAIILTSVIIIAAISIYKFNWALQTSSNPYRDIIKVLFGQFQEYFSGPRVVAQSIDMIKVYGNEISITTLMNDFLGSVPLVSRYVNQIDRTNVYFNFYLNVGNITHIIPMIGNGYAYFPLFPMIFTIIMQLLMIRFDFKSQTTRHIEFKYIYSYIGLFFAMSMGFNIQIIVGNFISYFILPWVIFNINSRVVLYPSDYKFKNKGGC